MINVVHWRDIVGKEFLDEFTKISRSIAIAQENEKSPSIVIDKLNADVREKYQMKHDLMRKCGYEDRKDPSPVIWHGWRSPYRDGQEVKFWCTAPREERKYIALTTFLEWKRMGNIGDEIDLYYEAQDLIQKVANDEGGFIK